jgi:hypothetical protein
MKVSSQLDVSDVFTLWKEPLIPTGYEVGRKESE